jgi:hypothetical protein
MGFGFSSIVWVLLQSVGSPPVFGFSSSFWVLLQVLIGFVLLIVFVFCVVSFVLLVSYKGNNVIYYLNTIQVKLYKKLKDSLVNNVQ